MSKVALALLCLVSVSAAQGAFLGVHVAPINDETRNAFKLADGVSEGVILTHIEKGSAAEKAGLREGDVLIFFDGKKVGAVDTLVSRVSAHKPGDSVTYKIRRGTGSIEGTLSLGRRPAQPKPDAPMPRAGGPRGKRAPESNIDKRLDKVAAEIEELRKKALAARKRSNPKPAKANRKPTRGRGSLAGLMRREEKQLVAAKESGDAKRVVYHSARLDLLREMQRSGAGRAPAGNRNLAARVARVEKKLDAILELLKSRR